MIEFIVRFGFDILSFVSVMVLIVLGLGVIASMMGIFNFAHGELVLLGAFTVFLAHELGLNSWGAFSRRRWSSGCSGWCWNASSSAGSTQRRSSQCSAPMRSG